MLSLRSRKSSRGSDQGSKSSHQIKRVRSDSTESQIELQKGSREWVSAQSQGQNETHVEPLQHDSLGETDRHLDRGIEVTRQYEIRNDVV